MSSPVFARRAVRTLAVASMLLLAAGAQVASAVTVRVDDDRADCPSAAFQSISAALKFVGPGSTVVVCHGRYVGSLVMDKPRVRLTGLTPNPADVIVLPAGRDRGTAVVEMTAPATTLANVMIRDRAPARDPVCPQVYVAVDNGPGPFAQASVIDGVAVRQSRRCQRPDALGVSIGTFGPAPVTARAIVRNSTVVMEPAGGVGVLAGSATIQRNLIQSRGFGGNGILVTTSGSVRIEQNDVSGYHFGVTIGRLPSPTTAVIGGPGLGNDFHHNGTGINLDHGVGGLTVANNTIHDNDLFGIEVFSFRRAVVSANRLDANGVDGIAVLTPRFGEQPSGNRFIGNLASNNGFADPDQVPDFRLADCWDQTADTGTGTGTAGTANIWIGNIGALSIPPGICRPPGP